MWLKEGFLKGESGLFLTPVLTLWGGGHIGRHAWRWVIVPSDFVQSFSAICANYLYCVICRAITYMCAWFKSTQKRQLTPNEICLAGLAMKKSGGTITNLHTWRQDGRHNRFSPLNFLGLKVFPVVDAMPVSYLFFESILLQNVHRWVREFFGSNKKLNLSYKTVFKKRYKKWYWQFVNLLL